ncbi:MAG: type I restriction endonuclease subunit S [Candidatus Poribacteria bacterium]|jgi:type I restriction enzyme S subunit|nr:type I restriction endonuclease subunit S [Candidatus Poribacteria bacterium]MDP6996471.1 type I restriction endonuclease subunit S [Candidatus Poribacteria bacterium]
MKASKSNWETYRFDQMAIEIKDRVEVPRESGFKRYVGLTHLDSGSLKIWRWGSTQDVEKQKMLFKSGDIIFGRRNAYLRRVSVADFDGVCSAHAMVLRARPQVVLPEFLPCFMQTETFWQAALRNSAGSLSPTINWSNLARRRNSPYHHWRSSAG